MQMNKAGEILSVSPPHAIPGGEIAIDCVGFGVTRDGSHGCTMAGRQSRIVGASSTRVLVTVLAGVDRDEVDLVLEATATPATPFR